MATSDEGPEAGLRRPHLRLLGWFFHHLYTTLAWAYDAVAWASSFGGWSSWRRTGLQALPAGSRLLEIGCGTGHLLLESLERGDVAFGIDASRAMTRLTARRLRRASRRLVIARARAQALPFPAAAFPAVVATFPSDFILEPDSLAEIRRVLAPGEGLTVVLSAWIRPRLPWERLARWLFDVTGETPTASETWLAPLRSAGFEARYETREVPGATVLQIRAVPAPVRPSSGGPPPA